MKIQETQKHFLSLMSQVGDYVFIDISKLDISQGYSPYYLSDIDSFTKHFSKEEILSSIKRANLVSEKYLNGKLVIQDNQKHNPMEVLDKEFYNNFRIDLYLEEMSRDKVKLNNLVNKFRAVTKDSNLAAIFADALKRKDIDEAVDILFNLDYLVLRKYMLYLIEQNNNLKTD